MSRPIIVARWSAGPGPNVAIRRCSFSLDDRRSISRSTPFPPLSSVTSASKSTANCPKKFFSRFSISTNITSTTTTGSSRPMMTRTSSWRICVRFFDVDQQTSPSTTVTSLERPIDTIRRAALVTCWVAKRWNNSPSKFFWNLSREIPVEPTKPKTSTSPIVSRGPEFSSWTPAIRSSWNDFIRWLSKNIFSANSPNGSRKTLSFLRRKANDVVRRRPFPFTVSRPIRSAWWIFFSTPLKKRRFDFEINARLFFCSSSRIILPMPITSLCWIFKCQQIFHSNRRR